MLKEIFVAAALVSTPTPAPNYTSWISPDIAEIVTEFVLDGKMYTHLDFNGDGALNIADVVGISKRYQDNITYGNEITLDVETIQDVIWENFTTERIPRQEFIDNILLYYEIDKVNGKLCRSYELTVSEITEARIYFEFEDYSDTITVKIDPFTETIQVQEQEENL